MKKKSHFSLTTGQFLFSKYMTIKGLYISNNVCWIFDKKSLIFKRSFQKRTSLISFQQTRLWIDMIFEVWELIIEQKDCQTRRISIEFAKSLTRMTSTLLDTPWKVDHLGAIQWTLRRKAKGIQISWGQRKNRTMSWRSPSKSFMAITKTIWL